MCRTETNKGTDKTETTFLHFVEIKMKINIKKLNENMYIIIILKILVLIYFFQPQILFIMVLIN